MKSAVGAAAAALGLAVAAVATAPERADAACQIAKLATLPVTMHGMAPWTEVKINGVDLSLILDSGAFYSSITPAKAAELKLRLDPLPWNFRVSGLGGEAQDAHVATVDNMTIAGATVPRVEFLVVGFSARGAAGLLGQNILHLTDVDYDLAHGAVSLIKPRGCGGQPLVYWTKTQSYSQTPLLLGEERDPHIYAAVFLNGVRLRAILDTGAQLSTITRSAAARAGITPTMPGARPDGASGGIGTKTSSTWLVPVASFKIGDEEIKATEMRISDAELPHSDMLLGADFFLSHRVYVSNDQRMIYFTYNGGPVFNLMDTPAPSASPASTEAAASAGAAPGEDTPKTAEEFARRAATLRARRDFEGALSDLNQAITLAPQTAAYYAQRADVRLNLHQPFLAKADLDEALKRDPDSPEALVTRAELRADKDRAGALDDLDRASAHLSSQADLRYVIAAAYSRLDRLDKAIEELDRWLPVHPDQSETVAGYTESCWARVMLNRDLDRAMANCNRAIDIRHTAGDLTARGMLFIRRGDYGRAISDFDGALTYSKTAAWALYGRALAERARGDTALAAADFAAARSANARIGELATKRGFESEVPARP